MAVDPPEDAILLGTLGKTFQLAGGLRFYGLGQAEADAIFKLERVFVTSLGERRLTQVRRVGGQTVLYISSVTKIEQAKLLVNEEVYVRAQDLPEPEAGFYLELLLELPVYLDGEPFGEVVDVISAGFQDLLAILHEGEEYLVPLQADYVQIGEEGVSIKDAPEGLLEPS